MPFPGKWKRRNRCGLELLTPFIDPFSQTSRFYHWHLNFKDPSLRGRYETLPDTARWQVTNLLLGAKSPMLWFFVQRKDSPRARLSEREIFDSFLERTFVKNATNRQVFMRKPTGIYEKVPSMRSYPGNHPDPACREIMDRVTQQPDASMREILSDL